jgi:hypothetical protein
MKVYVFNSTKCNKPHLCLDLNGGISKMKMITKKAWFSKNIFGWGYHPVSLEGWVVMVIFLIVIFTYFAYYHRTIITYVILAMILIILWFISWITSDEPGSSNSRFN